MTTAAWLLVIIYQGPTLPSIEKHIEHKTLQSCAVERDHILRNRDEVIKSARCVRNR